MEVHKKLDSGGWEPMEIDRSHSSISSGNVPSAASSPIIKSEPLEPHPPASEAKPGRKRIRKNVIRQVKKFNVDLSSVTVRKSKTSKVIKVLVFSALFFIAVSYYWVRSTCCDKAVLGNVRGPLRQKMYGQDRAIEQILDSFHDNSNSKITFLYGSTGVGKTYASQIILEQMSNYSNIFQFTVSSRDSFSVNTVLAELQVCGFIFIVVDDMSIDNADVKAIIKDIVNKSNSLQRDLYMILIFNDELILEDFSKIRDGKFREKLETRFRDVPASKYFVEFHHLTVENLRECINDALLFYKYKVPNNFIVDKLNSFNVTSDGCKGVDSKIKGMNLDKY